MTIAKPWADQHWQALERNYRSADCFPNHCDTVRRWYESASLQSHLTAVNEIFLRGIVEVLKIDTKITRDEIYDAQGTRGDRVLDICLKAGATTYLSGPSARAYMDEKKFERAGIIVEWMTYDYPEYNQLWGNFEHPVSILDLLFNVGASPRNWSGPVWTRC